MNRMKKRYFITLITALYIKTIESLVHPNRHYLRGHEPSIMHRQVSAKQTKSEWLHFQI